MNRITVLTFLCLAGSAAARVYLQDGFEGYPMTQWNGKSPGPGEVVKIPADSVGYWSTITGNVQISSDVAHSGKNSYKVTDTEDENSMYGIWDAVDAGYSGLTEIYIRRYIYFGATYDFPGGGKFMRINDRMHDPINWDVIELVGCWNENQKKGQADDFVDWRFEDNRDNGWDGLEFGLQPGKFLRQKWYCLEYHIKLNTPGVKDGLVEVWLDGVLAARQTGAYPRGKWSSNFSSIGALTHWYSNSLAGRNPFPNPQTPSFYYIDDVVISDKYIGPKGAVGGVGIISPNNKLIASEEARYYSTLGQTLTVNDGRLQAHSAVFKVNNGRKGNGLSILVPKN